MVPEKPPRRTKADKEPVTIDLSAEDVSVVAEPVRSTDSDEPAAVPKQDAPADGLETRPAADGAPRQPHHVEDESGPSVEDDLAGMFANDAAAEPLADTANPEPTEPDSGSMPPASSASVSSLESGSPAEYVSSQPASSEHSSPAFDDPEPARAEGEGFASQQSDADKPGAPLGGAASPFDRRPANTSALVAAGIVGGIVALLLAGSMQYAGVLPSASSDRDNGDLSKQIAALKQDIDALKSSSGSGDLAARVSALESNAGAAGDDAAGSKLASLEQQLQDVKSANAATAASDVRLSHRLDQAEAAINDKGPEEQVARAVAAAGLKAAIDRGGPFQADLQAYQTVAGDDPAIAQLAPLASVGVPSRVALQQQFAAIADTIIEASTLKNPQAGIGERLLSSAMSVVKVRRVGDVQGADPEAIVARIENDLRGGDLTAAASQWDSLPDPGKAASKDFKSRLDARVDAENLVNGTLSRALASSATATPAAGANK